jgi:beta-glucosidase
MSGEFPKDFLWGASTSSHQIEGGLTNSWTVWETANAERLAKGAEKRYHTFPSWPAIQAQAENPQNYISGAAAEFYTRYASDLDLAQSLNFNAFRFSLEWSRIEPRKGEFDQEVLNHYREMVQACRERGLEPLLTLWHWTMPVWLVEEGGMEGRKTPEYFARYTEKVCEAVGDQITFWITLNEPEVYAANGMLEGVWPPQKHSFPAWLRTHHTMSLCHLRAYDVIKKKFSKAQVGVSHAHTHFDLHSQSPINRLLKNIGEHWYNNFFLDKIKHAEDFIGLNNYLRCHINYGYFRNENLRVSDMGWELYPESMYYALKKMSLRYGKPVYITENGLADAKDAQRAWYLTEVLRGVKKALQEGVDVRGYLHWSLLDNFEWAEGFWPRFGLIEVDYATQKRRVRESAKVYAEIIKTRGKDL